MRIKFVRQIDSTIEKIISDHYIIVKSYGLGFVGHNNKEFVSAVVVLLDSHTAKPFILSTSKK